MSISTIFTSKVEKTEDEVRLALLGYAQEAKRIFGIFTNFGLASSMISVLLGILPLYTFTLQTGGPVVMLWGWIIVGSICFVLVACLAEICSAFPTMGALYYWAYRLGGPKWGPFASWTAGWCNLLGQIAGVASGGYSGAQVVANIVSLTNNYTVSSGEFLAVYGAILVLAGIVNTFSETLLTSLCYISVIWHFVGVMIIVIWMISTAPTLQSPAFVLTNFENETNFSSSAYVGLIGLLFAASTFTGYDTAAHVAEETTQSHKSTPIAMMGSVANCLVLGILLIVGMNMCIQDLDSLLNPSDDGSGSSSTQQFYTIIWQQTVGYGPTIFFLVILLVGIECSNCANLTSASRMVYAFSRDGALPCSSFFYCIDKYCGSPVRAIWLCVIVSFLLGVPGYWNDAVLEALFSLTATGLYSSYMIPIILRVTVSRNTFVPAEFDLGKWSIPMGCFSVLWCLFMTIVLFLPQDTPISLTNMNYSPIALGGVLICCWVYWLVSARKWFKVTTDILSIEDDATIEKLEVDTINILADRNVQQA